MGLVDLPDPTLSRMAERYSSLPNGALSTPTLNGNTRAWTSVSKCHNATCWNDIVCAGFYEHPCFNKKRCLR